MHNVKDKSTLSPWHPPGGQRIIDDFRVSNTIFKNDAGEGIRLVAPSYRGIQVWQVITTNQFKVYLAQAPRARFNPVVGRLLGLAIKFVLC
jgi:hypothetical protein